MAAEPRSARRALAALALAGAVALGACGGSDGDGDASGGADAPGGTDGCPPAEAPATPDGGSTAGDGTAGVADTAPREAVRSFDAAPPSCLDPDAAYSATLTTSLGELTIDLDQAAAPLAVNNFVFLARNGYYDGTVCHRVIQGFVVQCGDPTATGTGGPGYTFADELPAEGAYELGSVAMANSGPDTNGSQFFVISGPSGEALPPLYSLFGQVTEPGLPVVAELDAVGSTDPSGRTSQEVRIERVTITEEPA